jgi:hypothetical protein
MGGVDDGGRILTQPPWRRASLPAVEPGFQPGESCLPERNSLETLDDMPSGGVSSVRQDAALSVRQGCPTLHNRGQCQTAPDDGGTARRWRAVFGGPPKTSFHPFRIPQIRKDNGFNENSGGPPELTRGPRVVPAKFSRQSLSSVCGSGTRPPRVPSIPPTAPQLRPGRAPVPVVRIYAGPNGGTAGG